MANTTGWTRVADENDISAILDRMGATTDTGGTATTGTTMAKLNALLSNSTTSNTNISALQTDVTKIINNLLGSTSDTGGSSTAGTALAKLNAIINFVDALETNTNTNNTASKTGVLSQKLSYIIDSLVGTTTDTGGTITAGTAMAKLNALLNKCNNGDIVGKEVQYEKISITTGTDYVLLKSYTNLKGGMVRVCSYSATNPVYKIVVDGIQKIDSLMAISNNYIDIPFESSVELYVSHSNSSKLTYNYLLQYFTNK